LPEEERALINELIAWWYPSEDFDRHTFFNYSTCAHQYGSKNDQIITDKYLSWFEKIEKGQLDHWKNDHYGRLAYIIIAD